MYRVLLTFGLIVTLLHSAKCQDPNKGLGSWEIFTVNVPGSLQHHWGGYAEIQNRNYGVANHFYYYEAKAGLSYNIDNSSYFLLGTGRYTTYGYDAVDEGPQVTETRLWEQFTYNHFINRVKLEHRYRIEQRFVSTGYTNRFRYRLNAFIPLNKPTPGPNTFFAAAFGEVFFNNKQPNLERNRFSPSVGYQFSRNFLLQAGYINQRNYALTSSNDKNYLILTATYNILRK
jgi:hypothetical protein